MLINQCEQFFLIMIIFVFIFHLQQRKRKNRKFKFHRPKVHAPHRRPGLLRRLIAQQKLLG